MSEGARNIVGNLLEIPSIRGEINPVALLVGVLTEGSVNSGVKLKMTTGEISAVSSGSAIVEHQLGKKPICVMSFLKSDLYDVDARGSAVATTYQPVSSVVWSLDGGETYNAQTEYVITKDFPYYGQRSSSATLLHRSIHEVAYASDYGNSYGITGIDETQFKVPTYKRSGVYQYVWVAIAAE